MQTLLKKNTRKTIGIYFKTIYYNNAYANLS